MKISILLYHRILPDNEYDELSSGQEFIYSMSVSRFEEQIRYLDERGFQALSLEDVFQHINGKDSLRERVVVITFDDGLNSQYELTCPILRKYGFKATFFVTTDRHCSEFNSGKYHDPPLTEDQIKQMVRWGFEIGSHTHTHANLGNLNRDQIRYELVESKRILENVLGKEIVYLAVPGGFFKKEVKEIAKSVGYSGICVSGGRVGENHKDPFVLRRLGIRGYHSIDIFRKLISGDKGMIIKNRIELMSKYLLKNTIGIENYVRLRNYILRLSAGQRS